MHGGRENSLFTSCWDINKSHALLFVPSLAAIYLLSTVCCTTSDKRSSSSFGIAYLLAISCFARVGNSGGGMQDPYLSITTAGDERVFIALCIQPYISVCVYCSLPDERAKQLLTDEHSVYKRPEQWNLG